ncbi:HD-GYP domain-containing protein [Paludibacterium yongneupense]|uniref:HD-GYP domain-containing protein n=1 Tax=Paludibacterium yongneupense TaxID=400061 RepID=UPI00040E2B8E|nr:HD-GYP domain-containing protein [Paludibacterium yongneupense]
MTWIDDVLKSLYVMASLVEARDPYTGGHLWRVSQFSRLLAEEAGLPDVDVARVALGGFMHDLGKVGVPDAILNKPDRLTDEEYAIVKTHPELGERVLSGHPLAALVRSAVLSHHEMPNGRGYPHQLQGPAIPLEARIVGIADAFDAMTSTRPYRRGMPLAKGLDIIREALGQQFDREWGERFIALGEAGALDAIVGHSEPGIPLQTCPNCGPTIVVRRHLETGSLVYCRCCGAEATLDRRGGAIGIEPTGKLGSPSALQPDVDDDLVSELVHDVLSPGLRAAIRPLLAPLSAGVAGPAVPTASRWWQRLFSVS